MYNRRKTRRLYVSPPSCVAMSAFSIADISGPTIGNHKAASAGELCGHKAIRPPVCASVAISGTSGWLRCFLVWHGQALDSTSQRCNMVARRKDLLVSTRVGSYKRRDQRIPDFSKLTVTAQRLDGPAPPPEIFKATPSFREQDWKAFLVGGINFPTPGCWKVSGRYEDDELTFVNMGSEIECNGHVTTSDSENHPALRRPKSLSIHFPVPPNFFQDALVFGIAAKFVVVLVPLKPGIVVIPYFHCPAQPRQCLFSLS
jgi:hypothetical protein